MTDLFYKLPQDLAARTDITASDKLVFAVIVARIGDNGKSWPGIQSLMRDCGLCRDTVIKSIHRLEAAGLLSVQRRGNGRVNHYEKTSLKTRPVEKPDQSEYQTTGSLKTRPEPVRKSDCNRKDSLKRPTLGRGVFFKTFWEAYPRKVAKAQAEKIFYRLKPTEALMTVMLAALEQQKESDQWQRDGGRYIPYPATWLSQNRWEDSPSDAGQPAQAAEPDHPRPDTRTVLRMIGKTEAEIDQLIAEGCRA